MVETLSPVLVDLSFREFLYSEGKVFATDIANRDNVFFVQSTVMCLSATVGSGSKQC